MSATSLVCKIYLANLLVVAVLAGLCGFLGYALAQGVFISVAVFVCGIFLTLLANAWALRKHTQPMEELRKVLLSIQEGASKDRNHRAPPDPALENIFSLLFQILDKMEDDSLHRAAQFISSIELERHRIGRELHDVTSQTLATALIYLDLAEKAMANLTPMARQQLRTTKQLIQDGLDHIKAVVYSLRPVMLDNLGLVPALRWFIKSHITGTGITVVEDFEESQVRLPREVETNLYRVAQEALSNVVKHAQASQASIHLEAKKSYAVLAIIDNGIGFKYDFLNKDTKQFGTGLSSIRERVELMQGTLNIYSQPGLGTRIHVVVPFQPAASLPPDREQQHDQSSSG